MYQLFIKRFIDVVLSFLGLVILSPLYLILSLAIVIDDPGPVFFRQKRVGIHKSFFYIVKFRTMKVNTPHDMPTHMLDNPDQWITRVGSFLRKTSLDELPQIAQIFTGKMSIIGPRPALWNQDDLIAERDKYGANDVKPGLTGWAQINGRDALEIEDKARFDGEYVKQQGFIMDTKCFLGTIGSVLSHDGVVEGGTGELHKEGTMTCNDAVTEDINNKITIGIKAVLSLFTLAIVIFTVIIKKIKSRNSLTKNNKPNKKVGRILVFGALFYSLATIIANIMYRVKLKDNYLKNNFDKNTNDTYKKNSSKTKRILITGANSYIGMSVEAWLRKTEDKYIIDTLDMIDERWKEHDFSTYDVVYHVAGIAHADVGKVSEEEKQKYYKINTELAYETAQKAKEAGVKQFIFMSSMIVYSGCREKVITKLTQPKPLNFYGDSKWQAELKINSLRDDNFKVVVLRPPMIYGKGSKGNYPELSKLAGRLPVFPIVNNKRSMLYIDNLCEFVKLMIDNEEEGIFFPQNDEYTNTSEMVKMIADAKHHKIIMLPFTNLAVKAMIKFPGKIGTLAGKAFGDSAYEMEMSEYKDRYIIESLGLSILNTEGEKNERCNN